MLGLRKKALSQWSQLNLVFFLCNLRRCSTNSDHFGNSSPQSWQVFGFSFVWVGRCLVSVNVLMKPLWHSGQLCGYSPECCLMTWIFNWRLRRNFVGHCWQFWGWSSTWWLWKWRFMLLLLVNAWWQVGCLQTTEAITGFTSCVFLWRFRWDLLEYCFEQSL